MIHSTTHTADTILHKLKNNERCYYVRFGDGDLLLMDGQDRHSEQRWSAELQQDLIDAFRVDHPDYMVASVAGAENEPGMKPGLFGRWHNDGELQRIQNEHGGGRDHWNAVALHYKYVFDREWMDNLIELFSQKRAVYFGGLWGNIPCKNGYEEYRKKDPSWWLYRCKTAEIIVMAAGPTTKIIAKHLWDIEWKGSVIDIGSLADAMMNRNTRRWIRIMKGME